MNHVDIITDAEGEKIVVINDLRFKGRKSVSWEQVEECLREYIGEYIEVIETSDIVYISSDFPDEFAHSNDTKGLKGANRYAKANTVTAIKELVEIARNKTFSENVKDKHIKSARYGWYRYDSRFAIPMYDYDGNIKSYNIFSARIIVRHASNNKMYLYDILNIKKRDARAALAKPYGENPSLFTTKE